MEKEWPAPSAPRYSPENTAASMLFSIPSFPTVTTSKVKVMKPKREHVGYMLGLYWDNGKENGNYYSILELYWGNIELVQPPEP